MITLKKIRSLKPRVQLRKAADVFHEANTEELDETYLDSNQIYFVNQIVEYIVHNGMMKDFTVLQEAPFTDHGSIVDVFGDDLNIWAGIRKVIDTINANAIPS